MQNRFDAIVVGTGMGGGAAGYLLSQAGLKVLFLERGTAPDRIEASLTESYAEKSIHALKLDRIKTYEKTARATYSVNGWIPVLGAGLGGSSAVYGAVLLRLQPHEFAQWPYGYDDLLPFYDECDRLFSPRGTHDPLATEPRALRPPEPMAAAQQEFFALLARQGKHPFRSPIGYDAVPSCQRCFGRFCSRGCKRTSGNVFVQPALERHRAEIRYETIVESLEMSGERFVAVRGRDPGGAIRIEANHVFLAAGALVTPAILGNSRSARYPTGVGNDSDQLGRNLMRHLIDFYFLRTAHPHDRGGPLNQVTCTDYVRPGSHGGIIASAGELMPPELMATEFLARTLGRRRLLTPLEPLARVLLRGAFRRLLGGRIIAPCILEDQADPGNRVLPDSTVDAVRLHYRITRQDRKNLAAFRSELLRLFAPMHPRLIKVAEDNSFLAHACGTCRMGPDPRRSVTDPRGRVHGTENVHVVDASLFPSSGAANPSLTVAACAMKAAKDFLELQRENTGRARRSPIPSFTRNL
ncbi:MAG: GMC family oxidoreductase [Oligoflexia bacterium]|nr:GMC family oxidoreductase [Oligoflexia bacterium]